MKLVKLGLASVLAVGLSSSATGYAGTDVQIMGAFGFGSPKLTKLGKAHSKKFKEHFKKYQEEHDKLSKHDSVISDLGKLNNRVNAQEATEDDKKNAKTKIEELKKSDDYKKYAEDNKKNLEELHKKTGEKFEHHVDALNYHNNLKETNEEKELSGLGFGGGVEVSVRFEVADSVHVGPYVAYNFMYGSYEAKDAKTDSDKKAEEKKEEKSDKKDGSDKDTKSSKEEFKLSHHIVTGGGFATWKINDSFSVKGQVGVGGAWRTLTLHDVEKEIDGVKFTLGFGVNGTWHINSTFGVILGLKGYMIFAGEAKEAKEEAKSSDSKKADENKSDENKNDKDKDNSSSNKVDHHLASSIFELSLGLVMNVA